MIGIYKITSPKSRIYIGQSRDIEKRFSRYRRCIKNSGQIRLYRSFKKHGVENHMFEIIEECDFEKLNERERYWQDFYNVIGKNGLNCVLQQTISKPKLVTRETSLKISKSNLGKIVKESTKIKISKTLIDKYSKNLIKLSPRFKESNPNWKNGATFCKCGNRINSVSKSCIKCLDRTGENNPFYGKSHSDEAKEKIKKSRLGKYTGNQEIEVLIEGEVFKSLSEAARKFSISVATVSNRIKNKKFNNWKYRDGSKVDK